MKDRLQKAVDVGKRIAEERDKIIMDRLVEYFGENVLIKNIVSRVRYDSYPNRTVYFFDDKEVLEIYEPECRMSEDGNTIFFDTKWRKIND